MSNFCRIVNLSLLVVIGAALARQDRTLSADDSRPSRIVAQGADASAPKQGASKRDASPPHDGDLIDADSDTGGRKVKSPVRVERLPGVTPEREAAVMKFVERHHPELAVLLAPLKVSHPPEYSRAIHDLFRTSERLAQWHERDARRYELELSLWQAQSQIDLLTAQLRMSNSEALQTQLRRAVEEQLTLRQTLMRLERERVVERLKKLDEQIQSLETTRDEVVERTVRFAIDPSTRPATAKSVGGKSVGGKSVGGKSVAAKSAAAKSGGMKNKATTRSGEAANP